MEDSGVGELILTSIDHEGDMNGYDIETLQGISFSINRSLHLEEQEN